MDSTQLIGWILSIGFIAIFFLGLLWLRSRTIKLDKMLEIGDLELLSEAGIKTEILNHAPAGSQLLPYTPYVAIDTVEQQNFQ